MENLFDFLISIIEWTSFLIFPLVLLGYFIRKNILSIVMIATIMSLISLFLRYTELHPAVIVVIQIIVIVFLIRLMIRLNYLESLVLTSIGYGFFMFLQMVIVQLISYTFGYHFEQFFFVFNIKILIQIVSSIIIFLLSYCIYHFKYQLDELRHHIKAPYINRKYKNLLIINFLLTTIFINLNITVLLIENFTLKYTVSLLIMVMLFLILFIYFILHLQFQNKRIIEAKKFYLDQEQQISTFVDRVIKNYAGHFQAILKIGEKDSSQLIKEYVQKHQLYKSPSPWVMDPSLRLQIEQVDELLYAFLINKQKLASLLGITIVVSAELNRRNPTTLQQIRSLSVIMDDLIFSLFQNSSSEEKKICFHICLTEDEIQFSISSNLNIDEKQRTSLKLFDAFLQFEKSNAIVQSKFSPFELLIRCPVT